MLSSLLKSVTVFALAAAGVAFSGPVADASRACTADSAGFAPLRTSVLPFSNATHVGPLFEGEIGQPFLFKPNGKAQFFTCQLNSGVQAHPQRGHIRIFNSPRLCLTATIPSTARGPPFEFTTALCQDHRRTYDSTRDRQQFVRLDDGTIYYAGGTSNSRGCSTGFFGVDSTAKDGVVQMRCTDKANTIGLRIGAGGGGTA